ncbi:tubulin-folding cofactor B-like isoform X1 [Rhododendron vialii]|uniref:tubulin-folding cofactor B-like isoform X1 n=1 Tax=Rhododendron vialii TaxID=182163 RepID=UPI00266017AC|nr:tubulin-folding cofactor B-like isoform X1 [Rhododendron vialii]
MGSRLQIQGDESVLLRITHSNLKSFSTDVRFSLQLTVKAVKEKMWKKCGTSVNSMGLELYDDMGAKISELSDNSRPLGFYSPQDGRIWEPLRNIYQVSALAVVFLICVCGEPSRILAANAVGLISVFVVTGLFLSCLLLGFEEHLGKILQPLIVKYLASSCNLSSC